MRAYQIRDESELDLVLYERGMNQAYKDTSRCRHDPSPVDAPHTKAEPYMTPVQMRLAGQTQTLQLPDSTRLLLDLPNMSIAETDPDVGLLAKAEEKMVLPRPLADRCLSSMGNSHKLTLAWASHTLMLAGGATDDDEKMGLVADVIGALIGDVIAHRASQKAKQIWAVSWRELAKHVNISSFLEILGESISHRSAGMLDSRIARAGGSGNLSMAIRLSEIEDGIKRIEKRIAEKGLPPGFDNPPIPRWRYENWVGHTILPIRKSRSVKSTNLMSEGGKAMHFIFALNKKRQLGCIEVIASLANVIDNEPVSRWWRITAVERIFKYHRMKREEAPILNFDETCCDSYFNGRVAIKEDLEERRRQYDTLAAKYEKEYGSH